jgi:hypothetical protein
MPNNREETYNKHHTRQTDGALRFGVLLSCHPKPPHCAESKLTVDPTDQPTFLTAYS